MRTLHREREREREREEWEARSEGFVRSVTEYQSSHTYLLEKACPIGSLQFISLARSTNNQNLISRENRCLTRLLTSATLAILFVMFMSVCSLRNLLGQLFFELTTVANWHYGNHISLFKCRVKQTGSMSTLNSH